MDSPLLVGFWSRRRVGLAIAIAVISTACSQGEPPAPRAEVPVDAGALTLLEKVAAIVIPNCAVAGCHDSVSETHSMDLSTAQKIYSFWVGKDGFDHCTNSSVPRVIPGDADRSLVVIKITGIDVCAQSQRMPLPPREKLLPQEIETIREWIAAGAPFGAATDAGSGTIDAASEDAPADATADLMGCGDDAHHDGPPSIYTPDADDPAACTIARPCPTGMQCIGDNCEARWQCISDNTPLTHPCPTDSATYCGCDGVTFEAANTCPDRPFQYAGACGEGANCDPSDLRCTEAEPPCEEGSLPSVVDGRYGPCVPFAFCRCEYAWECPRREQYVCDFVARHCIRQPTD